MTVDKENLTAMTVPELEELASAIEDELYRRRQDELPEGAKALQVDKGYIDQASLAFEDHKRGNNWIATVEHDPESPGGLKRGFWKKGAKSYRKVPDNIEGRYIEVAADYSSSGGKKERNRHYFDVSKCQDGEIVLIPVQKP